MKLLVKNFVTIFIICLVKITINVKTNLRNKFDEEIFKDYSHIAESLLNQRKIFN